MEITEKYGEAPNTVVECRRETMVTGSQHRRSVAMINFKDTFRCSLLLIFWHKGVFSEVGTQGSSVLALTQVFMTL